MVEQSLAAVKRPGRSLAQAVVDALAARVHDGRLVPGAQLPTEGGLMVEFGVSRTVVREALSRLQAEGLVQTRHGIGSFVREPEAAAASARAFRIAPEQLETLRDVIAVLELRIAVEVEAAGLAAQRRAPQHLRVMRAALDEFERAVEEGRDAVAADLRFHVEVARATGNEHFERLLVSLGSKIIPRARLDTTPPDAARLAYLRRVNTEHEGIYDAIAAGDAEAARAAMRTHLAASRERRRRAHEASLVAARGTRRRSASRTR